MTFKPVFVTNQPGFEKKRILVIDDNRNILDIAEQWLVDSGFEVTVTDSGGDGLARALANPPDIVLTDIIMPEMDGIQVIGHLRQRFPHILIVAMSGGGTKLSAHTVLNLSQKIGASRILNKPFSRSDLIAAVSEDSNN